MNARLAWPDWPVALFAPGRTLRGEASDPTDGGAGPVLVLVAELGTPIAAFHGRDGPDDLLSERRWMDGPTSSSSSPEAERPLDLLPTDLGADFAPPEEIGRPRLGRSNEGDEDLKDSILVQKVFDQALSRAGKGDEEGAIVGFLRASKLAERAGEWYLAANACHRVGDLFRSTPPPHDLERAFRMYRRAIYAYEQCGHFDQARQLSYGLMWTRMWSGKEVGLTLWSRFELFVYWAVAGFGYRPLRVVLSAVTIVLAYALLYWSFDGIRTPGGQGQVGFATSVYFSGITFATVGYGDFLPAPRMRLVALTEGALGAFAMGFFVVVLANRLKH